jgi:hypothetical protein
VLGLHHREGLLASHAAAAIVLAVLAPLCARYRTYKAAQRGGWARYV